MGDLAIRTANQEDIPQLLNLMYQYIVDFYKRPKPTEESLKGLMQHLLDNPASDTICCRTRVWNFQVEEVPLFLYHYQQSAFPPFCLESKMNKEGYPFQ